MARQKLLQLLVIKDSTHFFGNWGLLKITCKAMHPCLSNTNNNNFGSIDCQ